MTPKEKELEERIEEVGNRLTTPPSDVQQLLLLLDKAENLLSKVEQCPPQSMHKAIQPSMNALITRDLLRHSDVDVKVATACCLSEITRITAPDAPFDDDLMKEIFGLIVGAFKNLDDMSCRSFSKRVSILETVAKVRSCVLMLDLECDDLILDMFHHFLKTIRPKHSDTVFSSMVTVMTLVIEESENISGGLLSCLLDHLKIDEKNILPSSKKLAEKVLVNCALKLKPYLAELFEGICTPLNDYSKIVAAVCQGNLDTLMQNEMNNSGEIQADDGKLSDRTLCDELPKESEKQEHKVVLPEKAVTDPDGSSKSVMSNGTVQMRSGDSIASEQKTEFSQPGGQLRDTGGSRLVDSDNLGSGAAKLDSGLNLSSRKGRKKKASEQMGSGDSMASEQKTEFSQPGGQLRDTGGSRLADSDNLGSGAAMLDSGLNLSSRKGRKRKAPVKLSANHDHNQIDVKKEAPAITSRRKGRKKTADLSQADDLSFKEVETAACSKPRIKNKLEEPSPGFTDVAPSVSLHSPNEHDGTHSRKGRPPRSKPSGKRNAAGKATVNDSPTASGHRGLLESCQTTSGDFPMRERSSNKPEVISEPERNILKFSTSKSHAGSEDIKTTPTTATCDSETTLQRHRCRSGSQREAREVDFLGKKESAASKKQKGGRPHVDDEDKEVKLKELVSSQKIMMKESTNENPVKGSNEPKSRRKRAQAAQKIFGTPKRRKNSNVILVGAKIRVWWPDDESFYEGVVDSFDRSTKKHTILYNDGDVEVLLLKEEKWEYVVDVETKTDGEVQEENNTPDINASDINAASETNIMMIKKVKSKGGVDGPSPASAPASPPASALASASHKGKNDVPLKSSSSPDSTIKNVSNPKRKGRPPSKVRSGDETQKKNSRSKGKGKSKSAPRHEDDKAEPYPSKPENGASQDNADIDTLKMHLVKSKGDSSRSRIKSNKSRRRNKSGGDAHTPHAHAHEIIKSNEEEDSGKIKSTESHRGRPPASRKARGGMKPRKINTDLNDNAARPTNVDAPKVVVVVDEAEGTSTATTGKKRKRGRNATK